MQGGPQPGRMEAERVSAEQFRRWLYSQTGVGVAPGALRVGCCVRLWTMNRKPWMAEIWLLYHLSLP